MYKEIVCMRLKAIRKELGLTQGYVEKETGVPKPNISRLESNRNTPNLETVGILAQYYNADMNWLFGITQKKSSL